MDFDNPKVYGDTSISDGLVYFQNNVSLVLVIEEIIMIDFQNQFEIISNRRMLLNAKMQELQIPEITF